MLCEICNKNEATIHIQEIVGGQKKSMHLCSSCAAAKQQSEGLDFGPFNLAGLLYKLSGNSSESADSKPEKEKTQLQCPQCGWDESKLHSTGRIGCSNCCKVFAPLLEDVLKNIHRGSSHVGKQPSGKGTELCRLHRELAGLQRRLQQAVEAEEYEKAAEYRDMIAGLKSKCEEFSAASGSSCNE